IKTFWEFFNRVDVVAKSPHGMRILKTLIYMTFLIHVNASAYYAVSAYEGFDANEWVYNNEGNAYVRCFYFAFRTATSISGKMVKPTNNFEYIFMVNSWLNGVFVFAFLIGQIRDIVATATQNRQQFRQLMNQTIRHMNSLNLPAELQKRVRLWLSHTWEQQKLNEENILNLLPIKMKTDIAINVHYKMLSKVKLFHGCERMVIRDLVVKLKPVLFLPGDYICKKGEIGQEMYIVNEGVVQVLGDTGNVLASLSEGSVFGEVSVLGIPGCSRRMAD
ncbi:cyclic nucleotide-gated cation channel beta-3-like protein, partial [Leptotrombidium deliense]